MSTLAQIEALKHEVTQLSSDLANMENRSRYAKQSLQSAQRKSRYLRAAQALRKPAEQYALWNVGVLIVGPTLSIAFAFVLLAIIGAPGGLTLFTVILAALSVLVILAVMLNIPATHSLPSLISDRGTEAEQFYRDAEHIEREATHLRQKISSTQIAINELLESDRLKRELLLKQNWKTMRDADWGQLVIQVFDALGASAEVAQTTGDQGIDLLVRFGKILIAVQAKGYVGSVGIETVQQVIAGKNHYGCDRAAVITNSRFTAPARALAASNRCFLIGEQEFPAFVLGSNLELFK